MLEIRGIENLAEKNKIIRIFALDLTYYISIKFHLWVDFYLKNRALVQQVGVFVL